MRGFHSQMEGRCAYVVLIVAAFWTTEAIPLPIASLIPVFLFPLLGVLGASEVCASFLKDTSMVFVGGLTVAIAIERCNLHQRIALKVLLLVGVSQKRLMLGMMLTTMFLSMWVPNAAATAMMIPNVEAVLLQLYRVERRESDPRIEAANAPWRGEGRRVHLQERLASVASGTPGAMVERELEHLFHRPCFLPFSLMITFLGDTHSSAMLVSSSCEEGRCEETKEGYREARVQILLAVGYSSLVGGTGSLVGSPTNLVFKALVDKLYGSDAGLNYATWMAFNVPGMLINVFIAWNWLQCVVRFARWRKHRKDPESSVPGESEAAEEAARRVIAKKYADLGSMSFRELVTLALFVALVLLWFFQEPQFIPGWASFIGRDRDSDIGGGTAAILIGFAFFLVPAKPNFWCFRESSDAPSQSSPALLHWRILHEKIPWGVVLLFGGGFAIAKASEKSCLSYWLGQQMRSLDSLSPALLVFIVTLMSAMITEVVNNAAAATIILPVLAQLMKTGFVMNVICVAVINLMINTLGDHLFDFSKFPEWAEKASDSMSSPFSHCNYTLS
ncbi:unnamed protein product [Darwinula stevensoni]|uniref:Uncharacterized protein n=1 Tax=Darwinula stevensoni TaxID=69355 RepID=A0A7R9A9Y4_9CRUS|nr:unnamed protein product [Darwinula stevensoni]CAG0897895.1 unnamed protein product [Darwinula stevensoni]